MMVPQPAPPRNREEELVVMIENRDEAVSQEIHMDACEFCRTQNIEPTLVEDRRRSMPVKTFKSPEIYKQFITFGYVSPHYDQRTIIGFRWAMFPSS